MRPIHFAADRGHFEVVQLLAAAGAQIDCQDDAGMTPLMYAASCDHLVSRAVVGLYILYRINSNISFVLFSYDMPTSLLGDRRAVSDNFGRQQGYTGHDRSRRSISRNESDSIDS
jgi:ankyrin repeat protein